MEESVMSEIRQGDQVVTQITVVEAEPGKQDEALAVMQQRAEFMAKQPGFVSISLHRSLDGRRIVNYIQWRNRQQLEAAHKAPEFRKEWGHFGGVTEEIAPNLYEVSYLTEAKAA
jgi:heme-degrading monooxygenase HmoA